MAKTNGPILEVDGVSMYFGGLKAVDNLSFTVNRGEIIGLIGPNGAGKTTVFNCVTQFYKTYDGGIYFHTDDASRVNLRDIKVTNVIDCGLVRTFQNVELVPDLTILDNLLIGAHNRFTTGIIQHIFRTKKAREEEKRFIEKAHEILRFLNIYALKDMYVSGQPYGILKKIEIARTLMSEPKMIILDEPAAGLNERETNELQKLIYEIREKYDVTILLIEHDMGFVMNICDRVVAINFGQFIAMDTPKMIQQNKAVQEAYLGKDD